MPPWRDSGGVLGWAVRSGWTRAHTRPPNLEHGAQDLGTQGSVTFLLKGRRLGAGALVPTWPFSSWVIVGNPATFFKPRFTYLCSGESAVQETFVKPLC